MHALRSQNADRVFGQSTSVSHAVNIPFSVQTASPQLHPSLWSSHAPLCRAPMHRDAYIARMNESNAVEVHTIHFDLKDSTMPNLQQTFWQRSWSCLVLLSWSSVARCHGIQSVESHNLYMSTAPSPFVGNRFFHLHPASVSRKSGKLLQNFHRRSAPAAKRAWD